MDILKRRKLDLLTNWLEPIKGATCLKNSCKLLVGVQSQKLIWSQSLVEKKFWPDTTSASKDAGFHFFILPKGISQTSPRHNLSLHQTGINVFFAFMNEQIKYLCQQFVLKILNLMLLFLDSIPWMKKLYRSQFFDLSYFPPILTLCDQVKWGLEQPSPAARRWLSKPRKNIHGRN